MRTDRRATGTVKKSRKNLLLVAGVVLVLCGAMSYSQIKLEAQSKACERRLSELEKELFAEQERPEKLRIIRLMCRRKSTLKRKPGKNWDWFTRMRLFLKRINSR